ncbi:MHYT domain-containing protein [Paraburkholderia aromaticivorans]|uniref:MHYT domain-containing protein n=1 Tax=Paraburkholderia aromaticivorans TaxID=2026199 RepID=UPI0038B9220D
MRLLITINRALVKEPQSMQSNYNLGLVAVSLIVATLASFTAIDLADRLSILAYVRARQLWLAAGALAMGVGIWSMHFIGMLSFSMDIPIGYDFTITFYSLAIAVIVSWFALHVVTRERLRLFHLLAGGVLMGLGIAGMHYMGMAAMLMNPAIRYEPRIFAGSIFIAIAASTAALWLANTLRGADQNHVMPKRIGAACVMGIAIAGMHYTGMAAANFPVGSICGAANGVKPQWLAAAVITFAFAILIATLLLSRLDARVAFLANSVARLNDQIDRVRGSTR